MSSCSTFGHGPEDELDASKGVSVKADKKGVEAEEEGNKEEADNEGNKASDTGSSNLDVDDADKRATIAAEALANGQQHGGNAQVDADIQEIKKSKFIYNTQKSKFIYSKSQQYIAGKPDGEGQY